MADQNDPGKIRPLVYMLPNFFTIMGLCAGMSGLRFALDQRWQLAAGLIVAAAIFDGLDGRSARLLNMVSKFGAELDSLADFISFGVAPAVIVYLWVLNDVRAVGWALALLFATCMALRLARFNVDSEDNKDSPAWSDHFFTGVPAPAAAGLAILPMMGSFVTGEEVFRNWLLNASLISLVSILMISRVPTYSIKKIKVSQRYNLPFLIGGMLLVSFLITEPWTTLSLVGVLYLLSIPFSIRAASKMTKSADGQEKEDV